MQIRDLLHRNKSRRDPSHGILAALRHSRPWRKRHPKAGPSIEVPSGPLARLPDEIWLDVFTRLDRPKDVAHCRQVSRRFAALAADNQIWQRFLPPLPKGVPQGANLLTAFLKAPSAERRQIKVLRQHPTFTRSAVDVPAIAFSCLTGQALRKFKTSRFVAHAAATRSPGCLASADDSIKDDLDFMLPFIAKCPKLVDSLRPEVRTNKQTVLELVRRAPHA